MFYPARMKYIRMVVLDEYRDALIRELHELGVVELRRVTDKDGSLLSRGRVEEHAKRITYALMRLNSLVDGFKIGEPRKKAWLSIPQLPEKKPVKDEKPDKLLDEVEKLLEVEAQVKQIKAELEELDVKKEEYLRVMPLLQKLRGFDFDLSFLAPSRYFFAVAGELPTSSLGKLEGEEALLLFSQRGEERSVVVVCALVEEKDKVMALLEEYGFQGYELEGLAGKPGELLEKYGEELRNMRNRRRELVKELQGYAARYEHQSLVLRELLEMEKERAELPAILGRTERTYVLEGYVPEKNLPMLENTLRRNFGEYVILDVDEPEEPEEEIPVLLENPKPLKPFEMLTEMFATPKYNEFDPTILFAPVFLLFFGIMLTDAVYGGIVALGAWYLYKNLGRVSPSARDFGIILAASGVSAVFFGVLFGSYLGSFFSPEGQGNIGTRLLGLGIEPVWMSLLQKEPKYGLSPIIVFLIFSLIIGAIHINIGNSLGLYKAWRNKDAREFLGHAWLLIFQLGVLCILLGAKQLATLFLLAALVILFYNAGLLGFFGITGYLSDSLSYMRLLALSLATGGIAIAVNIMTDMIAGIPVVGLLLAAVYFIVGHVFNTVLNTLGAFVHSLRLHYVEFFSKFYEGGGNKFKPFKAERKYTRRLENG